MASKVGNKKEIVKEEILDVRKKLSFYLKRLETERNEKKGFIFFSVDSMREFLSLFDFEKVDEKMKKAIHNLNVRCGSVSGMALYFDSSDIRILLEN